MQIRTTMRYYCTPAWMASIKKSTDNKCWWGSGEKGNLLHYWWEYQLGQSLWRTVWKFSKKLKVELPYDPAIPLLGLHPEKMKALIKKDTWILTPVFVVALFTIAKTLKQTKCPSIVKWIKKMWYIYIYIYTHTHTHTHTHNRILLSHKNEIMPFVATWMDLENIMFSEISQTTKANTFLYHLYVESKDNTNGYICKTDSQIQKKTYS